MNMRHFYYEGKKGGESYLIQDGLVKLHYPLMYGSVSSKVPSNGSKSLFRHTRRESQGQAPSLKAKDWLHPRG
jgi:hypothetical protein